MRKGIKVERPTSVYQSKLIRGRRCDKAREDEDMIMTQVTAERKKNYDGAKEFLIFVFSDVGLMVLCLAYAIIGRDLIKLNPPTLLETIVCYFLQGEKFS